MAMPRNPGKVYSDSYVNRSFPGPHDYDTFSGTFDRVDFSNCSLKRATLSGTFINAKFDKATLTEANFSGGTFDNVTFQGASVTDHQIRQAKSLRKVIGPNGDRLDTKGR